MFKKILIPLDNSPTDETILKHIRELARSSGADLVLVHVADGFAARIQDQLDLADSEEMTKDRIYLKALTKELTDEGFKVRYFLLKGDPAPGIIRIVREEGCDLIAMATHGHNHIADWFFGSVADGLRHKTSVPILMIKAPRKGTK